MANKLDGFRPIGDLILIKRDESLKMTKGGLYLPEQSQEQGRNNPPLVILSDSSRLIRMRSPIGLNPSSLFAIMFISLVIVSVLYL